MVKTIQLRKLVFTRKSVEIQLLSLYVMQVADNSKAVINQVTGTKSIVLKYLMSLELQLALTYAAVKSYKELELLVTLRKNLHL